MADYDSSLPVRTETDGDVVSKIVDTTGSNIWSIDANSIGQVNLNDGTNSLVLNADGSLPIEPIAGSEIIITDGTDTLEVNADGSLNVDGSVQIDDGTDTLAINTDGSVNSVITDGTDTLEVNTDGSINVVVQEAGVSATEIHEYATSTAVAPNTPTTVVDYTVTAGKTLVLRSWKIACSGKAKGSLQIGPAASEVEEDVSFVSTSDGNAQVTFPAPIEVAAGEKVLVVMTNRDKANADLYAWINGNEV